MQPMSVEFLGLFDTVTSVAGFTDPSPPGTDALLGARTIHQAIALDERRSKFRVQVG